MTNVLKFKPRTELISDRFEQAVADAGLTYVSMDTDGQAFAVVLPHDAPLIGWDRLLRTLDLKASAHPVTFQTAPDTFKNRIVLRGMF